MVGKYLIPITYLTTINKLLKIFHRKPDFFIMIIYNHRRFTQKWGGDLQNSLLSSQKPPPQLIISNVNAKEGY